MLGWPPETVDRTPIPRIERALVARFRFHRQQFRGLASLLGVPVAPEDDDAPGARARQMFDKLRSALSRMAGA